MTYYVDILTDEHKRTLAFTYDAAGKVLIPVDDRVDFESSTDGWLINIEDDYPMLFDSDGLLIGDIQTVPSNDFPRLDFFAQHCGVTTRIATLTKTGRLSVASVIEAETLPAGLNILDNVSINADGITATAVNEVWFLALDGNYVVSDGMLIRVRI